MICDICVEYIVVLFEEYKFVLCIVDFIQMVMVEGEGVFGGVVQVCDGIVMFMWVVKEIGIVIVFVGYVIKDGMVVGLKVMEYIVDIIVFLEMVGVFCFLCSVKNCFGQVGEFGVFEMCGEGLIVVDNFLVVFFVEWFLDVFGSVVVVMVDGQCLMLLEVQVFVFKMFYFNVWCVVVGFDFWCVDVVLVVLEWWLDLIFGGLDVYVNFVGGFKVFDFGFDFVVVFVVYLVVVGCVLLQNVVVFGEVGFVGEVCFIQMVLCCVEEVGCVGYKCFVVLLGFDG